MEIKFGPAGNSQAFVEAGIKRTADVIGEIRKMGLSAYEYPCGRGVNIGAKTAGEIGKKAAECGVTLSVHAPYFINLSSRESERMEKNIAYVLSSCAAAKAMGARRIVVHGGGLGKLSREKALEHTICNLKDILREMDGAGYSEQILCVETMGKINVFGTLEEICQVVRSDDRLMPCIDFGHLNAQTKGRYREAAAFAALFDTMEAGIGKERTQNAHCHFSKIEYGKGGEIRHLTFADETFGPEFAPVAEELAKRGYTPTVICESAGTQAEDAVSMMKAYREAQKTK